MGKSKVYVSRRIPDPGLQMLRCECEVVCNPEDRPASREELLQAAADADGVIGLLTDRIDAAFFDAAPQLKGYANYAVGYDNIDVAEATRRRIPVSNTPDVLTAATAELAWTLLLATARRAAECDAVMRQGLWQGWGPLQFIGADVSGRTLGIAGAGRIGTAMARMSRGFDMQVVYLRRASSQPNTVLEQELGARAVDFNELLQVSDFISVHLPLTPETRHMFNASAFAKMKRTAILVNTGRGPVINEDDLAAALRDGVIGGAGLDVYENEPLLARGLKELDNTVLLPHIGSATPDARNGMAVLAAANLLAMLRGETPPTCLNPEIFQAQANDSK